MRRFVLIALVTGWTVGCNGPPKESDSTTLPVADNDGDGAGADVDCNDSAANIYPGATEICDGVDNNCDEAIDDQGGGTTSYLDDDGDGFGTEATTSDACVPPSGYATVAGDCDDTSASISPDAPEVCDGGGVDEDCDGLVNDADTDATQGGTWYADQDGDGYGDPANSTTACSQPVGYAQEPLDCDDGDNAINPDGVEVCNGYDDDCDGAVDDNDADVTGLNTFYMDMDGDGYGTELGTVDACVQPVNYAVTSDDCDDSSASAYPGAQEVCDGLDNDCDALVDMDDADVLDAMVWYSDSDGDGFGDPATGVIACEGIGVSDNTDCDDGNVSVYPGAQEVCDGQDVDEDCDGLADDSDLSVSGQQSWYSDSDGDGYGNSNVVLTQCDAPASSSVSPGDCDDAEVGVNPGASELCDSIDNDCDALVDDADPGVVDTVTWYMDADNDGYGDSDTEVTACTQPAGYVENADDPLENATMASLSDTVDVTEATDVAANATSLFVVGFNAAGDAAVFGVNTSDGSVTELYSGDPLVQPTGLALSLDGQTLYVADAGAESNGGVMRGGIFEVPVSGGSATELGASDLIDMPGDVAISSDGLMLYVTGMDALGDPAIFSFDLGSWVWTEEHVGSPLVDPLALVLNPDGSELYVLDSMAADGEAPALLAINAGFSSSTTLASGFEIAFPGGLAISDDGNWLFYTKVRSAALVSMSTDGSMSETFSSGGARMPVGLTQAAEVITIANLSGSSDLYTLSY